jgi:Fic family protein
VVPTLPLSTEFEAVAVLKKLTKAHQALAELKGFFGIIPNQNILITTLSLQEAKDSSAIENIITTQDDLYKSDASVKQFTTQEAKEVHSYSEALRSGYEKVKKTGNVIYIPPQDCNQIRLLMNNLEEFINNDLLSDADPLVKMAIIHHQFESIHPFYDGNGRTGRIINILYLVKQGLLDAPILYLSRYINKNKSRYYELLQAVRDEKKWVDWTLYILDGIEQTARQTTYLVQEMRDLMQQYKYKMRQELPKIYEQDLLNNLFKYPYTKIEFVMKDLEVTRITATKYLDELARIGLISKHKKGKENHYMNEPLCKLLLNAGST